ncbi:935_t:CDS:2 [Scutellospora calospora]|uniref:935_t:CDS:1 n=1 Tax=Scutellospora calospora TaxID=85575 RepID=A0ACA9JUU8_9GLOM|nr:935_t:CDS:2 [Scutellospora calospora]
MNTFSLLLRSCELSRNLTNSMNSVIDRGVLALHERLLASKNPIFSRIQSINAKKSGNSHIIQKKFQVKSRYANKSSNIYRNVLNGQFNVLSFQRSRSQTAQDLIYDIQKRPQVLSQSHSASHILQNTELIVVRQLEMLNVFLGFEQANKYAIHDQSGNCVGYIAEEEQSLASVILRQLFRTHRKFTAIIMDLDGNTILKVRRPFAWINSRIFISTGDEELIGEVHQQWHLWRRRYNLFTHQTQFALIDAGFLSWDFIMEDEDGDVLGNVTRNFTGFAREIFTDYGQYMLKMNPEYKNITLDERAVILAAAISIDFDYFSRHLGFHFPFPFIGEEIDEGFDEDFD